MLPYANLKLASDIEAKGFYDVIHTQEDIHCICSVDIETDIVYLFHNHPEFDNVKVWDKYDNKEYVIPARSGTLEEGIEWWSKAGKNGSLLIIHNCFTYDKPVINKIWPENDIPWEAYHDTFIQSKVQWFERPTPKGAKSAHGLQAYGIRCGIKKPEITEWKTMDAYKLHRVVEDCRIQAKTYLMLEREAEHLKASYGIDFTQALKIEAMYAEACFEQEQVGLPIDEGYARKLLVELDTKIALLAAEIEPQLPPTIKGKGTKVSRSEIATLLGFDGSRVKDKYIQKRANGEVVTVVEKPYFKPSTNFTNKADVVYYSGFNISHGESPRFAKKGDFNKWVKENYPDTKPKDWDAQKTVVEGFVLDRHCCEHFGVNPEDTDIIVGPHTRITIEASSLTQGDVVKSFLVKLGWKDAEDWNLKTDFEDNFIKVEKDTWVSWPAKAAPENQMHKLVKKGEYLVSSPKLTEDDYKQLPEGIGKKIAEYNTYCHRRNFLENPKDPEEKGILSYLRPDGRIPAGVNNFNTRSGRASHRVWVNAPGAGTLFGEEIRSVVKAPEGKKIVGVDMKSAQLGIAAYYANNYEYYNNVATGMEVDEDGKYVGKSAHCVNARMFGMVTEDEWQRAVETQDESLVHSITLRRKGSKGGSFAVIFGASGKKVAKTIGIPEKEGNARKNQFLQQMGLDGTIKVLGEWENTYKYKGGFYLPLAFGYWLWNNSSHKSVNTIVQGFEALAQKLAVIRFHKERDRQGLTDVVAKVLDYHDEVLLECVQGYEKQGGDLVREAYRWAPQQIFNYHKKNPHHFANPKTPMFYIDLDGGAKVGDNYYDVH